MSNPEEQFLKEKSIKDLNSLIGELELKITRARKESRIDRGIFWAVYTVSLIGVLFHGSINLNSSQFLIVMFIIGGVALYRFNEMKECLQWTLKEICEIYGSYDRYRDNYNPLPKEEQEQNKQRNKNI